MCILAYIQWPIYLIRFAIVADTLGDGHNMVFIKRTSEGRASMPRGAKRDPLSLDRRIRPARVVGGHEPRHIEAISEGPSYRKQHDHHFHVG